MSTTTTSVAPASTTSVAPADATSVAPVGTTSVASANATGVAQDYTTVEIRKRIPSVEAVWAAVREMCAEGPAYVTTKQLTKRFNVHKSFMNRRQPGTNWPGLYGMRAAGYLVDGPVKASWRAGNPFVNDEDDSEESSDDEDDEPLIVRKNKRAIDEAAAVKPGPQIGTVRPRTFPLDPIVLVRSQYEIFDDHLEADREAWRGKLGIYPPTAENTDDLRAKLAQHPDCPRYIKQNMLRFIHAVERT